MFELILSNGKGGHIAELLFPNSLEHLYWQFLQCFLLFEISPGGKDSEPEHGVACWWTSWGSTELPAVTIQPPPTSPLVLSHFIIFSSLFLPASRLISALLKPSQLQAWRLFWHGVCILMPVCLLHILPEKRKQVSDPNWSYLRHTRSHQTKLSAPSQLVSEGPKLCVLPKHSYGTFHFALIFKCNV